MLPVALIGLGAGAASALLMATMASRSPFALMLVLLAPLPVMIAALGWTHWAAMVAAAAAAIALALAFGEPLWILIYLIGAGVPAWWLGYLAMLARGDPDGHVEWYPVGRLVMWCAIIASADRDHRDVEYSHRRTAIPGRAEARARTHGDGIRKSRRPTSPRST